MTKFRSSAAGTRGGDRRHVRRLHPPRRGAPERALPACWHGQRVRRQLEGDTLTDPHVAELAAICILFSESAARVGHRVAGWRLTPSRLLDARRPTTADIEHPMEGSEPGVRPMLALIDGDIIAYQAVSAATKKIDWQDGEGPKQSPTSRAPLEPRGGSSRSGHARQLRPQAVMFSGRTGANFRKHIDPIRYKAGRKEKPNGYWRSLTRIEAALQVLPRRGPGS
jgi:hypothetical protein